MNKHLSLALRILFAIAGVAYIAWNVDWKDYVQAREAATVGAAQHPVPPGTLLRVIAGEVDPAHQREDLRVENPLKTPEADFLIPAAELNNADRFLLRPSILTTLRHANHGLLLLGFIIVGPVYPVQAYRWLMLMRARGLDVSYGRALKLTMVGAFFNYCMPGSTGGDVVKAFYAARRSDRRTDAVMSVVFDRITGLLGLVGLGGLVGLLNLHDPLVRRITANIWIACAIGLLAAAVYFSRRLRKWFGVDALLGVLPGRGLLAKIDSAAVAYRNHKGAVLAATAISLPVHLALSGATAVAGYALGMKTALGVLLTVLPVVFLSGALPITPQGAGVWELLGKRMLLNPPHVTMNQIVGMLLMIRLYQLAYSLIGSVFLLRGDIHLHPEREAEAGEPATA